MTSHALILYRGKFLLILRDNKPDIPYPNLWAPVGGNSLSGELPEQTLRRELKEEANLKVDNFTYLGDMENDAHLFLVKISTNDFRKIRKGAEGQKLEFFDFKRLQDLDLAAKFKNFLDKNHSAVKIAVKLIS